MLLADEKTELSRIGRRSGRATSQSAETRN
jgi:hypothetical protein